MMMSLGMFVFEINKATYQQLKHNSKYGWQKQSVVGARPAYQFTGLDEETINLSGTIYTELSAGEDPINQLKSMAESGKAFNLVSGQGENLGIWAITEIDLNKSGFIKEGAARKIEFTIPMVKLDDGATDQLANLDDFLPQAGVLT